MRAVDAFWEPVVVDEINAGMWRRTWSARVVTVETRLATGLDHEQRPGAIGGAAPG